MLIQTILLSGPQVVNTCHFRENYHGLEGIPDVVILTSQKNERRLRDEELGYRYRYDYIECATLWLNATDKSPTAYGKPPVIDLISKCFSLKYSMNPR